MDHLSPKAGAFQHVCLVNADHLLVSLHCGVKGGNGNALDLVNAVRLGIVCFFAVFSLTVASFTEINTARQLSDDQQVKALLHQIGAQRAGILQNRIELCRTQIGVKLHCRADAQKRLFGAQVAGQSVPFGAAHRTKQNAVGCKTPRNGLLGQRGAGSVDGASADEIRGKVEGVTVFFTHCLKHSDGAFHNLGSDTVALEQCNIVIHNKFSPFALVFMRLSRKKREKPRFFQKGYKAVKRGMIPSLAIE